MTDWTSKLNQLSFSQFRPLFSTLTVPPTVSFQGVYRGSFVGPGWLRALAGPALALNGLGGWSGKRFQTDGSAHNLVQHAGVLEERFPMRLLAVDSALDGLPTLALHYDRGNPFPWPRIVDEIRQLDPGAYLGMTYLNWSGLRQLAFPFLLESEA